MISAGICMEMPNIEANSGVKTPAAGVLQNVIFLNYIH
jgi:hypothetical protein